MLYKTVIFSLGLLSLTNCNAQKEQKNVIKVNTDNKTVATKEGETVYLKEGENKFFKEYQMNITFKGISEDSRCPQDVNCVWAGIAVAQIELMGTTTRPMTVSLSTADNRDKNLYNAVDFNGYTISLAEVNPYPGSSKTVKPLNGNYKIGLIIKKSGKNSTTR